MHEIKNTQAEKLIDRLSESKKGILACVSDMWYVIWAGFEWEVFLSLMINKNVQESFKMS